MNRSGIIAPMNFTRLLIFVVSLALAGVAGSAQGVAVQKDKAATAQGSGKSTGTTGSAAKAAKGAALVDINTASPAELKAIPGIGDAYSAAIIKNRPYANKAQLVSKKVLPQGVYNKVKDKIIAKQ